jgi:NAD(P)-dependent dehydrogenase (short-subunit alcohol dehydrogenase family)
VRLKGKIAFITGAAQGISESCAKIFAGEEALVIIFLARLQIFHKILSTEK